MISGRAVLVALALLLLPRTGHAHGREPMAGAIAFDPTDRDHVVFRTTWALYETHDAGTSWLFRCATSVGYDRTTEDPAIVVTPSGAVVAGTFDGIVRGDACAFTQIDDADVRGTYSIDVDRDPVDPGTVWAVQSPGAIANTIVRSTDEGRTWELVGTPSTSMPILLLERIAIAPSDPSRLYASGAFSTGGTPARRAFVLGSEDGGRTFVEHEIALEGEERNVHVLAVDPTDPDRVFARVTRRVTDEVPERLLLSEDGGETWETAASLLEITGFAISDDGVHAWVGGWDGAFLRSDARGAAGTFVPVSTDPDLRVRCLAWRPPSDGLPGELWVCIDDIVEDFAVGRSTDLGQTLDRVWGFEDASPETGCSACTSIGATCPAFWPDVIFDLGLRADAGPPLDAGPPPADGEVPLACIDGGVAPPAPPTCACRASAARPLPISVLGATGLASLWRRRRGSAVTGARA